jgi:RND family efflux transporter MFP subunit
MSTAWLTIPGVLRPQAAAAAPAAGEVEFTEPAGRLSRLPFPHWSTAAWLRAALGLLAVLSVIGCKEEPAAQQEVVRPVKVAVVAMTAPGHTLAYSGVVRSRIESALGFRVPGKIVERVVNVGDRVAVGQPIARLDDTDLNLSESSARAAVVGARSRRDMARDNLERAKVLLPKRIIAQATYDTRHNEFDAAVSALDSAEAQLRQAANAVSYATLKADKAGIVTAVTAEPGQVVSAGQPVITLAHADEMEIAIAVPEQDAGYLTIGQPAKITLWAGPRTDIEGRIREIAGQADEASRTYAVRIAVAAPPQSLRLGMTASVVIRVDDEAARMVVPVTALAESDGHPVVFVVDPAKLAVRRTPVTVGGVTDNGVRITTGLHAGEVVVTAGVQFLRDGMRVRCADEPHDARCGSAS